MKTKTSPTPKSVNRSSRRCGMVAGLLIAPRAGQLCAFAASASSLSTAGRLSMATTRGEDALGERRAAEFNTPPVTGPFSEHGHRCYSMDALGVQYNRLIATRPCGNYALSSSTNTREHSTRPLVTMRSLINTTGNANTATGENAHRFNASGYFNTAVGFDALEQQHGTGSNNTAVGIVCADS